MKEKINSFFLNMKNLDREKRKSILMAVCLVAGLILVSFFTPVYDVEGVIVEGNDSVTEKTIIDASGIKLGESIFKVSISDVKNNLSKVAFVDSAKVRFVLPDKIKIIVKERQESAYISFIGNYIGIDDTGKILEVKQKAENVSKPVVYGLSIENFEIGSTIYTQNEEGKNILYSILQQISVNEVGDKIKYIDVNDDDNIRLTLSNDIEVKLGSLDNIKYKMAYLKSVIEEIKDVNGGVLDITDTENVTYRAK